MRVTNNNPKHTKFAYKTDTMKESYKYFSESLFK